MLRCRNGIGRSGALFVPGQAAEGPRPLVVLFHGSGIGGDQILAAFQPEAVARGIFLLAPDSGRSPDGVYNWQVPDTRGETTADVQHVASCLDELFGAQSRRIDHARIFAAGHSGGASSAAYLATNDARFRGFAVLHGGVFAGGLGQNRVSGWFSTGAADQLRPPVWAERAAADAAPHLTSTIKRVYPGGHDTSAAEIRDLLDAWLGS